MPLLTSNYRTLRAITLGKILLYICIYIYTVEVKGVFSSVHYFQDYHRLRTLLPLPASTLFLLSKSLYRAVGRVIAFVTTDCCGFECIIKRQVWEKGVSIVYANRYTKIRILFRAYSKMQFAFWIDDWHESRRLVRVENCFLSIPRRKVPLTLISRCFSRR